jgi:hypothetical protein
LLFSHIEVNEKLCKLVPQSTWDSQAASRQDFYGKVDLGKPSDILLEQLILETLDEINERLKPQNFD